MPVSPELAAELAKDVLQTYTEAEEILLRKVARRLARGMDDDSWAEQKLAETQALRRDAQAEVRRLATKGPDAVEGAVTKAYNRGSATAATDLKRIGTPESIAFGVTERRAVEALVREAVTKIEATHLRILRSVDDLYRSVIAETSSQIGVGAVTRREAAQGALNRFATRGITGFVDSAGRSWDLASYTEMATRTTSGHAAVQGHLDRLSALGHDLVIVSDAPEECRVCRPWEGAVLSISGMSRGRVQMGEGSSTTVKGTVMGATAAGLFHPGCRHSTGIFIEGSTRRMRQTADPVGEAERVQQRYLERGVRSYKRREAVALSPEAAASAGAKRREWQSKLKTFVDSNDRKRLAYRERLGAR